MDLQFSLQLQRPDGFDIFAGRMMNNPDVTGNKASFEAMEASIASFVSVQVAGVELNPEAPSTVQYVTMPTLIATQTLVPNFWLSIPFGIQTILTLTPGVWLVLANGVVVNNNSIAPNNIQSRITDPGSVNTVTQSLVTLGIGNYGPFSLLTVIDTNVYGLQFILQLQPTAEAALLASTGPSVQLTPQFIAVELTPH